MKKLINEVVTFALIISFTSNTLATSGATSALANPPVKKQQTPVVAVQPFPKAPEKEPVPRSYLERLIDSWGFGPKKGELDSRGNAIPKAPQEMQNKTKTFSQTVLEHFNLGEKPKIIAQPTTRVRSKKKAGAEKYQAAAIPNKQLLEEMNARNGMNRRMKELWAAEQRSQAQYNKAVLEMKKTLRPEIIKLINKYYEDTSLKSMVYSEKRGTIPEIKPIENSSEHIYMEQYFAQTLFRFVVAQVKKGNKNLSISEFEGYLKTTQLMMQKIFGVTPKAINAFVHDNVVDIYEKLISAEIEKPLFIKNAQGIFEFEGDKNLLNLIRQNSNLLVGYEDGRILRNADGSINNEATTTVRVKNYIDTGKKDRFGKPVLETKHELVQVNSNLLLASGRPLPQNTSAQHLTALMGGMKKILNSHFNAQEEAERTAAQNKKSLEIANDLIRRNNTETVQPELFDKVATDKAGRSLGIVNADGTLNLAAIDLPGLKAVPTSEVVTAAQISQLLQMQSAAESRMKNGFYYPSKEANYILKLSQEEAEQYKKQFPELSFEKAGVVGNTLKIKVKNPRSNENAFIGYKIQPELLKKFSPLMVQDTLVNNFKDAATHATASFPIEALTFYIGIYLNTLMELVINYKDDPAAMEKFYAEATSVPGQLSFFAFMLGNRMFTNLVGPNVSSKLLKHLLPFLGMGIGSISSAISHDIMSITKDCAINIMKADEFNDEERANTMEKCQATYNQIVNSANAHNYIVSFMNILAAGGLSAIITPVIAKSAMLAATGVKEGVKAAALKTGNKALVRSAMTLEGVAFEYSLAAQETRAYSLPKNLMNSGKLTTSTRLANWFGFVKNKPGNMVRIGSSFGRLGWKIAGGIVIFLAMDKRTRPYTYFNEQLLMGAGNELSMNKARLRFQLDHLAQNNWGETVCQQHTERNKKNGFRSFYVDNPKDCNLIEKVETVKKSSKLWRDAILYKFMTNYSNWLTYVEAFQSEWSMAYTFNSELLKYAASAKSAEFDGSKSQKYNPLIQNDPFWGVLQTERASKEKNALTSLQTITMDFTFAGMNKMRAQRVIDLLPYIGRKLKEIRAKDFNHKDWKNVETILLQLADNISNYLVLSETQKMKANKGVFSFLTGKKKSTQAEVYAGIANEHFSKKVLVAADFPAYDDYGALINTIDIINRNFDAYTSEYKKSKIKLNNHNLTSKIVGDLRSLYDKAILFKELKAFLGKPVPSGRGEAFIRSFDEYIKSSFSEEQIKNASKKTGSVGRDLMWHALCGEDTLKSADVENKEAKETIVDARWGKNVKFKYPRLVDKKPSLCDSKNFATLTPNRNNSSTKNSGLDYLMKNLSPSVVVGTDSIFETTWEESIVPRLEEIYKKFDISYQALIQEQFIPKYLGLKDERLLNATPLEAYKIIQAQKRAQYGYTKTSDFGRKLDALGLFRTSVGGISGAGGSIIQTYVDELDSYLRVLNDSFEMALKQDIALKFAGGATTDKNRVFYLEATKKRKQRFDALVNNFKKSFIKIILTYGKGEVDVEAEYSAMLLTYLNLIKSVGLVGDITIEQKNINEDGNTVTKVVASASRNTIGELILQNHIEESKVEEINTFVKAQQTRYGVNTPDSVQAFTRMFVNNTLDQSYAGKMRLRLENQPDIRQSFQLIQENAAKNTSMHNPYNGDRNMSLPVLDPKTMQQSVVPGALMYVQSENMIENQFLGLIGASQSIDELMEEVYFNVNILKAASMDNKYRDVERARLKKFKGKSMGGG